MQNTGSFLTPGQMSSFLQQQKCMELTQTSHLNISDMQRLQTLLSDVIATIIICDLLNTNKQTKGVLKLNLAV